MPQASEIKAAPAISGLARPGEHDEDEYEAKHEASDD